MFGPIIRHLLDNKLTTIKEIEEVTGRGSSTIYRWINNESDPHHTDMRLLIRHMSNPQARRSILNLLTADLPIVINWISEHPTPDDDKDDSVSDRGGHEVLDRSLIALDCLTHALSEGNDALRRQSLTKESYIKLVSLVDETIHHLTTSKNMLQKYAPKSERPASG